MLLLLIIQWKLLVLKDREPCWETELGLTGSRRLLGGQQGNLGERQDVDVRRSLAGRRRQGG